MRSAAGVGFLYSVTIWTSNSNNYIGTHVSILLIRNRIFAQELAVVVRVGCGNRAKPLSSLECVYPDRYPIVRSSPLVAINILWSALSLPHILLPALDRRKESSSYISLREGSGLTRRTLSVFQNRSPVRACRSPPPYPDT